MVPRRQKKKKRKLEKTAGARTSGCDKEEEKAPSVYLVVGHEVSSSAYSVFKVDPYAGTGGDGGGGGGDEDPAPVPIPRPLGRLCAKFCMSFVPVRSRHGRWIVGVGGDRADKDYAPETIVFDTETRAVIQGPKLSSTKLNPVVLTIAHKIYALARYPAVKGELDFVPWFEVLDLSKAQVVVADGHHLESCEWKPPPRPPCFPWDLTPMEHLSPPTVTVESYVALESCILLSISQQPGTHMFDVDKEQWAKLDDDNLPFIRGAVLINC